MKFCVIKNIIYLCIVLITEQLTRQIPGTKTELYERFCNI